MVKAMNNTYDPVDELIKLVKAKRSENPADSVAVPAYTPDEFAKFFPGVEYAEFKRRQRQFIFALCVAYIPAHFMTFVEIDYAGYMQFIAERNLQQDEASRQAYAEYLLKQK